MNRQPGIKSNYNVPGPPNIVLWHIVAVDCKQEMFFRDLFPSNKKEVVGWGLRQMDITKLYS